MLSRAHRDVAIPEGVDLPRFGGHGAFAKLATLRLATLRLLLRIVECEIKRIKIAESTTHIESRQFAVDDQRYALLTDATM